MHRLRVQMDGVLVGVNTFLIDNPRLNPRTETQQGREPYTAIVLDPTGRGLSSLKESRLWKVRENSAEKIIWVTRTQMDVPQGVENLVCPPIQLEAPHSPFDLHVLKQVLYKRGVRSLLVEGGAGVFSEFVKQRAFERLYAFIAPKLLAGKGLHWLAQQNGPGVAFQNIYSKEWGGDIFMTGTPVF